MLIPVGNRDYAEALIAAAKILVFGVADVSWSAPPLAGATSTARQTAST